MLVENVFETGSCHRSAFGVDEDLRNRSGSAYRQPSPEIGGGVFPKWQRPLLATLAADTDARGAMQRDVLQLKPDQFRDAQSASETKMQHGTISNAEPRGQ